jgi:hypothetical protein
MNKQYAQLAKSNERWQRRNLSRLMAITTGVLSLLVYACSAPAEMSVSPKDEPLLPVRLNMRSGAYYLPECDLYGNIPDRLLLELPTVQEAALSGYRAGRCPDGVIEQRLAIEKARFGEMQPTVETQERKGYLHLIRQRQ